MKKQIKFPEFSNAEYCYNMMDIFLDSPLWNFFIDVGPGIPESEAWIIKERFPTRSIVGFEPQRQRFENIKKHYPGQILNVALASYTGKIQGFMGLETDDSQFYINPHEGYNEHLNSNVEVIDCMSIDSIFSQMPASMRAFVWIDAEGAEFEVLRGAIKSMTQGFIPFISVEINFDENKEGIRSWPKWNEIIELLHCCGYIPVGSSSPACTRVDFEGDSYINGYNVSHPENNSHADIFFVWNPEISKTIKRSFFSVY